MLILYLYFSRSSPPISGILNCLLICKNGVSGAGWKPLCVCGILEGALTGLFVGGFLMLIIRVFFSHGLVGEGSSKLLSGGISLIVSIMGTE